MDRTRNRGAMLAAVLALVALLVAGCGGVRQQAESQKPESQQPTADSTAPASETAKGPTKDGIKPMPGYIAADIAATDVVTGKRVTLSELRGQVVFLNFWATWCPPCKEEMPEMEALHNELGAKVRMIALGADGGESPEKLRKYGEAMGLTFTLAHDGGAAARAYLIQGVPTSFFIDKNGKIQVRHTGPLTLDQMKEYISQTEKATESTGQ